MAKRKSNRPRRPDVEEFSPADLSPHSAEADVEEFAPEGGGTGGDEWDESCGVPAEYFEAQEEIESQFHLDEVFADPAAYATGEDRLGLPNIVGTSVGEKFTHGSPTGQLAVRVYVKEKVSDREVADGLVASQVQGVPTDVVAVGEITPLGYRARQRPAKCGSSVGHVTITAGTIGCLCVRRKRNRLCLLSFV
jgi:hypothetical protein